MKEFKVEQDRKVKGAPKGWVTNGFAAISDSVGPFVEMHNPAEQMSIIHWGVSEAWIKRNAV